MQNSSHDTQPERWFHLSALQEAELQSLLSPVEILPLIALILGVATFAGPRFQTRFSCTIIQIRHIAISVLLSFSLIYMPIYILISMGIPVPNVIFFEISTSLYALILALIFTYISIVALKGPVVFRRSNSKNFRKYYEYVVYQADDETVDAASRDVCASIKSLLFIVESANKNKDLSSIEEDAFRVLYLFTDRVFCQSCAVKNPDTSLKLLAKMADSNSNFGLFGQIVETIAVPMLTNPYSAFRREHPPYETGILGRRQESMNALFGGSDFLQSIANEHSGPLSALRFKIGKLDQEAYSAAMSGIECFIEATTISRRGLWNPRALTSLFDSAVSMLPNEFEVAEGSVSRNEAARMYDAFSSALAKAIESFDDEDTLDALAEAFVEATWKITHYKYDQDFFTWTMQHNSHHGNIHQLINNESYFWEAYSNKLKSIIEKMDDFANFQGARYISHILLLFGFLPTDNDYYPKPIRDLHSYVVNWCATNILLIHAEQPGLIEVMLPPDTRFDEEAKELVRMKEGLAGRPPKEYRMDLK